MKQTGKHIFHGFKYAVPVIILYSISLAIDHNLFSLGTIPEGIYLLIIPVLTAAISYSITRKILIIPALILGVYAERMGIGFFGGIFGGLLIGYTGFLFVKVIPISNKWVNIVMGYIVIAFASFAITYGLLTYIIGPPILFILDQITVYISAIKPTQILFLVAILATLTTIDLGGPFNKLAFGFVLQFYLDGHYNITGPALISVAIPPISIYLALKLIPKKFNTLDQSSKKLAFIASLVGLTEGALVVSFRRPLKMIPIIVCGSVVGSVFAAYFGLENQLLMASVLGLPGANNFIVYILAHMVGVFVILCLLYVTLNEQKEQLHLP